MNVTYKNWRTCILLNNQEIIVHITADMLMTIKKSHGNLSKAQMCIQYVIYICENLYVVMFLLRNKIYLSEQFVAVWDIAERRAFQYIFSNHLSLPICHLKETSAKPKCYYTERGQHAKYGHEGLVGEKNYSQL